MEEHLNLPYPHRYKNVYIYTIIKHVRMLKRVLMLSIFATSLYACSESPAKEEKKEEKVAETASPNSNPDYEKGLALVAKSDCLTCHKVDEKLTGPAYHDVANKYPNTAETVDQLAVKIIKGGYGVWGSIPMPAHASLSQDDAKQMVKYIMTLKTN